MLALGYVGSSISTASDAVLPDPKENISKANIIGKAFGAFKENRFEECVKLSEELLRDNDRMIDVWALKSRALEKLDRREEAIAAGKQGLRLAPDNTSMAVAVANLSLQSGKLDDAEAHAKLALKSTPMEAHRILTEVALARKDYAKARQEAVAAGGEKRDAPLSQMLVGRAALDEGKVEEALKYFDSATSALAATKRQPIVKLSFYRGDALARLGRADEAEQAFLTEIKLYPGDPQPYKNLILLYATEGKNKEATELIFSLEKSSPTLRSYLAISETLKIIGDRNGQRFWAARGLNRFPTDRQLQALYRG
jgi:tetratricopeptide (TPR) repeat protein